MNKILVKKNFDELDSHPDEFVEIGSKTHRPTGLEFVLLRNINTEKKVYLPRYEWENYLEVES